MSSKDSAFSVNQQLNESLSFAHHNSPFVLTKRKTYNPILNFFLLQLLFCFTYVSQSRAGKGNPRDNTIIK